MIPLRLYAYAAAVLAVLAALWGYGYHQKKQGRAEVQAKFDAYIAKQTADTLQASLANQETSLLKQKAVDRSRQDDYENAQKLAAANSNLRGAVAGLRNTIAAINHSAKADGVTEASAGTDDAAKVARELLGECADRYIDVAREAGELAAQVIGLQGFVLAIEESARR
jgi:murein L,D-transpeptidase YcbB/YkuD